MRCHGPLLVRKKILKLTKLRLLGLHDAMTGGATAAENDPSRRGETTVVRAMTDGHLVAMTETGATTTPPTSRSSSHRRRG